MTLGKETLKCEVCKDVVSKYKCPTCRLKYCSVGCFKDHKKGDTCVPDEETSNTQCDVSQKSPNKHKAMSDGELSESSENDMETEDKVSKECLERLVGSKEIKDLLKNPHLQDMLVYLDSSENPTKDLENAMQEPIFTEFANTCLNIVEPPDGMNKTNVID
ncbi:unnamed protein product [Owenia fusiformis]|uniref:Zinc finger HIT domain-containing protein 3 n=1 Tax=Owenia fusiformis TaxID=6347 RepID=A0A8J1UT38_OWEFU|nr:unnamed protein product [Owenia fusiformis]